MTVLQSEHRVGSSRNGESVSPKERGEFHVKQNNNREGNARKKGFPSLFFLSGLLFDDDDERMNMVTVDHHALTHMLLGCYAWCYKNLNFQLL